MEKKKLSEFQSLIFQEYEVLQCTDHTIIKHYRLQRMLVTGFLPPDSQNLSEVFFVKQLVFLFYALRYIELVRQGVLAPVQKNKNLVRSTLILLGESGK